MTRNAPSLSEVRRNVSYLAARCVALAILALAPSIANGGSPGWCHVRVDPATGMTTYARGELSGPRDGSPLAVARRFLEANSDALGLARGGVTLEAVYGKSDSASHHARFRQTVNGLPVEGAEIFVHMALDGRVVAIQNGCVPVPDEVSGEFRIGSSEALRSAIAGLDGGVELRAPASASRVYHVAQGALVPAWKVMVPARRPLGDWRIVVRAADGAILERRDLLKHASAYGRVFDPNPVATSGDTTLEDENDSDQAALTRELRLVHLENLDGSGYLRGAWADARNRYGRAWSGQGDFRYTRSDSHFEEVMFYHHVDRLQAYLGSLGITSANRRCQVADVHGTAADNSYYSSATREITYGDGGVDDAEDADILLHEYGHAIQDDQVPGWGESHESAAMGEGFGDWLAAAAFSDAGHPDFDLAVVGDWDATYYSSEEPPALRRVDEDKVYPRDMRGQAHADGEIWSRALWDLRWLIGRDDAMRLVLEGHLYCTPVSDFFEGALAIASADDALFGGRYRWAIREAFVARGILEEGDLPDQGAEVECRVGNVVSTEGTHQDVLFVNDSTGSGAERIVTVEGGGDLTLRIVPPQGQESAKYVLYGWLAEPTESDVTPQPYGLGTLCFPGVVDGGSPDLVWNTWNHYGKVGVPDFESEKAPWSATYSQADLGIGTVLTLQGYVQDPISTADYPASVTNAVVVRAE